jgi:uncharacterized 2Fe-2S/4Fe-4S cluster protein (DUF4445 family)
MSSPTTSGNRNHPTHTLQFPQLGREIEARHGETILESARRGGIRIVGACGGRGTCGSCVVQIVQGQVHGAKPVSAGRRAVRACQATPLSACILEIAPRSLAAVVRTDVETAAGAAPLPFAPAVACHRVKVPAASLANPSSDAERLAGVLPEGALVSLDITAARSLPRQLRAAGGEMSVVLRGSEIIACAPLEARTLGLAIDFGTTNVAAFLIDLDMGTRLASLGIENPQTAWGADLISRINYAARSAHGGDELRAAAVTGINALAHDLSAAIGAHPAQIVDLTLCGNTAMQHLVAGLPVDQLGRAPFVPAIMDSADIRARDLGIDVSPGAYIHIAASIGGFVGGDHVAALLATESRWGDGCSSLVMDIGTNTEISLIHAGRIQSASCPSGPALEGGHISCGMRAAEGAIEHVRMGRLGFTLDVIGNEEPVGLCGSGVLDALAMLYRAGVTDARGRIGLTHACVSEFDGRRSALLAPGVMFTQDDVRAVQLAKAAIRTGTELLLQRTNLRTLDIDRFIIAGAFGAYLDIDNAIVIGLLPDLPAERFEQVGNAAGTGVRRMLTSRHERAHARLLARRCEYVELSLMKQFQATFLAQIGFPATRSERIAS